MPSIIPKVWEISLWKKLLSHLFSVALRVKKDGEEVRGWSVGRWDIFDITTRGAAELLKMHRPAPCPRVKMSVVPRLRNPSLEEQILSVGKMFVAFPSGWKYVIPVADRISACHLATLKGEAGSLSRGCPVSWEGEHGLNFLQCYIQKPEDTDRK